MSLLRSDRAAAAILLVAAAAGLVVANAPIGDVVIRFFSVHGGVGAVDLSLTHWISDGLLAVFFFAVSVELQFELTRGELRSARRAVQPAIAAAGGVVVPIVLYLAIAAGSGYARGWPIPTATDVAFALGVLAVFGRGLPSGLRAFLLALAILDDIVGIVLIAVLYAHGLQLGMLVLAAVAVAAFGALSRALGGRGTVAIATAMGVLAVAAWVLTLLSGIHPTIAGVALGLVMSQRPALRVRHVLEPWINGVVLPLFAFTAALVPVPVGATGVGAAFWAVLIALPVGKLVGIVAAAWIAQRTVGRHGEQLPFGDLVAAGALGGIGFTVSLLLAGLAFSGAPEVRDQAVLGVLGGSVVALVAGSVLVSWRARGYRLRSAQEET